MAPTAFCATGLSPGRPFPLEMRLRAPTRDGGRSADTVDVAMARHRSWGLVLDQTA